MELDAAVRSEVLDAIACGIVMLDTDSRVLVWNRWMVRHSGIPDDIAIGRRFAEVFPDIDRTRLGEAINTALSHRLAGIVSPSIHQPPLPLYRQPADRESDARLQQMVNITPIRLGPAPVCILQIHDVTLSVMRERRLREQADALQVRLDEIHALQEQIALMNAQDPLSGLFNRDHLDELLKNTLAACREQNRPMALCLLDIDLLKQVNEAYGRAAGDAVIKALGAVVKETLPPHAIAGHHESDQFLVMLPGMSADQARDFAETCRTTFAVRQIDSENPQLRSTLSAGVASFPQHGETEETLLECLNLALFLAKHDGYDQVVEFDPGQSEIF